MTSVELKCLTQDGEQIWIPALPLAHIIKLLHNLRMKLIKVIHG